MGTPPTQATVEKPADNPATNPWLTAVVALAILLAVAFLPKLTMFADPLVAKQAPDFSFEVIHNGDQGSRLALSDLKGHPVLLDFWASWCGPCQMQAPILERLSQRYKDRGLIVVGVNTNDKPGAGAASAQKKGLSYPIVFDGDGFSRDVYGVTSLPTLVLVGKDGMVKMVRSGLVDEGSLEEAIHSEL